MRSPIAVPAPRIPLVAIPAMPTPRPRAELHRVHRDPAPAPAWGICRYSKRKMGGKLKSWLGQQALGADLRLRVVN